MKLEAELAVDCDPECLISGKFLPPFRLPSCETPMECERTSCFCASKAVMRVDCFWPGMKLGPVARGGF